MARKLIVEIVGDASSLERSFNRAQRSTRGFGRDMERAGRGAVVASVGFRGLGRSVAFASGAFLGGAGLAAAFRSTIGAAEEAQRVQSQLTNVLQQMGKATRQNVTAIDERTTALSQMSGFDDELATQTFVNLLRVTGNVTAALRDNAIAADIARGRNIGLDAAAKLVTKAELGQAGALRRVGIEAKNGASSVELLDLLQRKFAGSAEAYGKTAAGAQDRFRVAVENTQEIIGQALLPAITNVLTKLTNWLNKTENQKKIQDAANESVRRATDLVEFLGDAYNKLSAPFKFVTDHDPFRGKGAVELIHNQLDVIDNLLGIESATDKVAAANKRLIESLGGIRHGYEEIEKARQGATEAIGRGVIAQPLAGGSFIVGRALTEAEQLAIALGANPDNVQALRRKRELQQRALDFAEKMIREQRGNTKKFAEDAANLASDIAAINERLAGIAQEKAQKARDARAKAINALIPDSLSGRGNAPGAFARFQAGFRAPLVRGRGTVAPGILQAAQFQALGLTATGDELAPTRNALRAQLAKVAAAVKGTILDTQPNRNLIAGARRVLNLEFGKLNDDVARRMKELFDALDPDKSEAGRRFVSAVTGRKLSQTLGARLGLTPEQIRQLRLNVTGAHFTSGSLAGAAGFAPTIQTRVDIDGRQVALATHRYDARARRQTAPQTRGRVLP